MMMKKQWTNKILKNKIWHLKNTMFAFIFLYSKEKMIIINFFQPTVLILKCDGFSTSSVSDSRNAFAPDNDDDDDDG